jgi:hypothetical protein
MKEFFFNFSGLITTGKYLRVQTITRFTRNIVCHEIRNIILYRPTSVGTSDDSILMVRSY